jgi:hypothetical protein
MDPRTGLADHRPPRHRGDQIVATTDEDAGLSLFPNSARDPAEPALVMARRGALRGVTMRRRVGP